MDLGGSCRNRVWLGLPTAGQAATNLTLVGYAP